MSPRVLLTAHCLFNAQCNKLNSSGKLKLPTSPFKFQQVDGPTFESRHGDVDGLQALLAAAGDGGDDDAVVLARFESGDGEMDLGREVAGDLGRVDAHFVGPTETKMFP